MIDPHVHLRDWEQSEKESLAHGLMVAKACKIAALFDMPNTNPPLTTRDAIVRRLNDAAALDSGVSYHIWAGLTAKPEQIREAVAIVDEFYPSVVGLKFFAGHSTGNMGLVDEGLQRSVYHHLAEANYEGVVALHCEKESLLEPHLYDPADFATHSKARPPASEVASITDQVRLADEAGFGGHLHICHLSTIEGLQVVEQARVAGVRISCGVTAHHLLLSEADASNRSLWAKMNPPLRSESQRRALFEAAVDGRIDWLETDHAPHTIADKEGGASGIPGFSGLLLAIRALIDSKVGPKQLERMLGGAVIELFGLEGIAVTIPSYEELSTLSDWAARQYPYDSFALLR